MKPTNKWISTAAVVLAMLIVLYYNGVMDSKIAMGIAATAMGSMLLFFTFIVPPPEDE